MQVLCKRSFWFPASCKEDADILFLDGKLYQAVAQLKKKGGRSKVYYISHGTGTVVFSEGRKSVDHPRHVFPLHQVFEDYFYTENELRKLKLEKINGKLLRKERLDLLV